MLKKLFAYDFRCIGRMTLPTLIGMVLTALLAPIFFWISLLGSEEAQGVGLMLGLGAWFLSIMTLIIFALAPVIINCYHFGKNLFFDEGYLMMTLPASEHQLLLAKIFAASLWLLLDILMLFISVVISVFGHIAVVEVSSGTSFFETAANLISEGGSPLSFDIGEVVIMAVNGLVTLVQGVVLYFTIITFGCLMMPKHKVMGSLLIFIVASWIWSIINEIFNSLLPFSGSMYSSLLSPAFSAVLTVLCYFLTHRMLKKRINLE